MKRKYVYPSQGNISNATQLISDRQYRPLENVIKNRLQCTSEFMNRLDLDAELEGHTGCVNCLEWSESGKLLASASDDYHVMIWDPFKHKRIIDLPTPHTGNIFSVKFMPKTNDSTIITGAADKLIYLFDLNRDTPKWKCSCHSTRVKRLATSPSTPYLFWSSSEDGCLLQYDTRQPHVCSNDDRKTKSGDKIFLLSLTHHVGDSAEIKCIAINPIRPELIAIGSNDIFARIYDRRMIKLEKHESHANRDWSTVTEDNVPPGCATYFCAGHFNKPNIERTHTFLSHKAITYLTFSPDGNELLVNMGAEQIYLFDINSKEKSVYLQLPEHIKCEPTLSDNYGSCSSNNKKHSNNSHKLSKNGITDRVESLQKMGIDFLENEKYLQAINKFTIAIQLSPNCANLYLNRATAFMRRHWFGDHYAALRDCHTALHIDPTSVEAQFRLSRALLELGFLDESNECLEELRYRFPHYSTHNSVLMLKKDINVEVKNLKNRNATDVLMDFPDVTDKEKYWRKTAKDYKDRFVGHCNITTDIKEANFFGGDGNYIVAGSDDGNFFIWERPTNNILNIYKGDSAIVNCVQPHPTLCMLATSGIDHEVRLWCPKPIEKFESKTKIIYIDNVVAANQQRLKNDLFDMNTSGDICRAS